MPLSEAQLRVWTKAEDDFLRAHARTLKPGAMAEQLARTQNAVRIRLSRLKLSPTPPWTTAEDAKLRRLWRTMEDKMVAEQMGRSWHAVRDRAARVLKLPCGIPQGHACLWRAAERCGVSEPLLRKILKDAGVRFYTIPRAPTTRSPDAARKYYVDTYDAERAVEAWLGTEHVQSAAFQRGVYPRWLRIRVESLVGKKPVKFKQWRVPTRVIEQAMKLVRVFEMAKEFGCATPVLAARLVKAGLAPKRGRWRWFVTREQCLDAVARFPLGKKKTKKPAGVRADKAA